MTTLAEFGVKKAESEPEENGSLSRSLQEPVSAAETGGTAGKMQRGVVGPPEAPAAPLAANFGAAVAGRGAFPARGDPGSRIVDLFAETARLLWLLKR
ncbi:hypothetical protein [Paenibacillus sp. RC84]|uniref:hypothetical protein n=1 Tax=Paenibacillus sp. RC84 TaxID=3156252 RepID=UPI003515006D